MCDTTVRPPTLHLNIAMLGAVTPYPADASLNPDYIRVNCSVCVSHICDTAWTGHLYSNLHVPNEKPREKTEATSGTVTPAPADVRLNVDKKG
jgi:hypothetical protein